MKIKAYTKNDTSRLKGLGILMICLHNYFHWLKPSPGENEFYFSADHISIFFSQIGTLPGEFFNLLLSYFGHFGVQVFVFISGYGLAASMMKREQSWGVFVVNRWKKLYPLLLTGFFFFIFFGKIVIDGVVPSAYDWREMGYKALLIHTLLPNSGLSLCGPWWFFGLIFQLYLLFPLLFILIKRFDWKALLGICLVAYGMIFLFREAMPAFSGSILMQNAPGHLPEFCFGIWLYLNKDKNLSWVWLLTAVTLFCLGNFFSWFYPFTFLAVAVMTVFVYQALKSCRRRPRLLSRFFVYIGGLSMALFATHGFLRDPFLIISKDWGAWGHFFSGVMFFVAACLMALAAKHFYNLLLSLFSKIPVVENRTTTIVSRCAQVGLCLFAVYLFTYYILLSAAKETVKQIAVETGDAGLRVDKDREYVSIAAFDFPRDSRWLRIDGEFDMKSLDTQAVMPLVVLELANGRYWTSALIPASYNDGQPHHYEFHFEYKRPFVTHIKGRKLKMYFWNNMQGFIEADKLDVKLSYR